MIVGLSQFSLENLIPMAEKQPISACEELESGRQLENHAGRASRVAMFEAFAAEQE
jgi:hypothetical protein